MINHDVPEPMMTIDILWLVHTIDESCTLAALSSWSACKFSKPPGFWFHRTAVNGLSWSFHMFHVLPCSIPKWLGTTNSWIHCSLWFTMVYYGSLLSAAPARESCRGSSGCLLGRWNHVKSQGFSMTHRVLQCLFQENHLQWLASKDPKSRHGVMIYEGHHQ